MIKIGKDISNFSTCSYKPKTKEELMDIISKRIKKEGHYCNLNDIDTSLITDMSYLFKGVLFNGDISNWNTSRVTDMSYMFAWSSFNGDVSKWNISNVINMSYMFNYSNFRGDISNWDTSIVKDMSYMFKGGKVQW